MCGLFPSFIGENYFPFFTRKYLISAATAEDRQKTHPIRLIVISPLALFVSKSRSSAAAHRSEAANQRMTVLFDLSFIISVSDSFQLERAGIESVIRSLLLQEVLMAAALNDAAVVKNHNDITVHDS